VLKIECLPLFQNNVNATLFDSAFLALVIYSHLFANLFSVSFFRVHFLVAAMNSMIRGITGLFSVIT